MAVTPAAWQTERMKKYAQEVPAATVARDQLEVSVAEFSTHENQRVTKVLNDALQAALTGSKTPQQALTDAQREADRGCARTSDAQRMSRTTQAVYGWLLLPAVVLLAAFTTTGAGHAVAQLLLHSQGSRPARFVGLENYGCCATTRCSGSRCGTTCGSRWVRSRPRSPSPGHGAVGQRQAARSRLPAHGVLHPTVLPMVAVGQYLAVLLHAAVRTDCASHAVVRPGRLQLAGQPATPPCRR